MRKEEISLLDRCFQGESAAWDEFVEKYFNPVAGAIKYILGKYSLNYNDSELEDLTQEVFVALMEQDYRRLRLFRGEKNCSLATYLRVLSARKAIDYLRRKGREKISLQHYKTVYDREGDDHLSEASFCPEEESPETERMKAIIAGLSPPERLFIHLHFYRELSLQEVAKILKVSPETAYTRKSRLLKKIRLSLKKAAAER